MKASVCQPIIGQADPARSPVASRGATQAVTRQRRMPTLPGPVQLNMEPSRTAGHRFRRNQRPERRMIHLPRVRHRSEPDHEAIPWVLQAAFDPKATCHEPAVINAEGAIPHPIC